MPQTSEEQMQHLPDKNMCIVLSQEIAETNAFSGLEDFKWKHESILLLCSLYKAKKEQFASGFVKKRDLWAEIATEMVSTGYSVNHAVCEKKWHNLCATFRKLKEYNRYTTRKRKCWAYYHIFQEIFDQDSGIQTTSLNPAGCLSTENSCSEAYSTGVFNGLLEDDIKSNDVKRTHNDLKIKVETHSEGEPGDCEQDISSMLSVTLEEDPEHPKNINGNVSLNNEISISRQLVLDDFKWTHDTVMLLCSLYIIRKEQFQSGAVKKRDLWSDIAQEMNREGYAVTCSVCEKKWHNLIATYKKVILYNKKKTWPYLHIFRKILEDDQVTQPVSLNISEYSTLSNSYSKDITSSSILGKIAIKGDDSNIFHPPDEQFHYGELGNRTNDTIPDDFKWTHDSVISLCTLYKERQEEFQSNAVKKRDLWSEVARDMNVKGYAVTWAHCEKKWYNLYATYKKVTDQNRKRVRIWSTWPYLRLFQDIFDKNNIDKEPVQPASQIANCEHETTVSHLVCSPSSSNSDYTSDALQETIDHSHPSNKRQCLDTAPNWFLEYCDRQRDQEERRHQETERRHRELIEAISRGNQVLRDLNENLKLYLNKCL